jgi:hypothetical protein
MVMVADWVPGLKRWIGPVGLKDSAKLLVIRVVVAFLLHAGRMSCLRAAGAVRCETRHRAQISRFLARPRWRKLDINSLLRQRLLEREAGDGLFVFILDATLTSQAGKKTENTYSTGNRQRRPRKGRRYGKNKHAKKNCHRFTMGLLLTPSGVRIPFSKPYHTREYCKQKGLAHRTTAEAAADLIRELPLPEGADVIVLGDTAYDAAVLRDACDERGYRWLFPCNPERVLAGPKGKRPKVRSPEGLVEVVTADPEACSGLWRVRRLSASVATSDRAESENTDVHRPPGKTTGALGRRGPARLFDNEQEAPNCHARRRENPDEERPAAFCARRDRVVLAALANRSPPA